MRNKTFRNKQTNKQTSSFWSSFQNWWVSKTKETVTLSNSMILYGIFENMEYIYSLNYALLIAKYSIHNSCLHETELCFDSFLALLKEIKGSLSSSWMNSPMPSLLLPLWQNESERNYWYENICHLHGHSHENQVIFMGNV